MEVAVKIAAACVMTGASAWGGRLVALAQLRRVRTLQEILGGARRLSIEMLEHRLPLRHALGSCGGIYEKTADAMQDETPPEEAYRHMAVQLRQRGGLLDSLEEGDMTALGRLFGGLGTGGLQKQRLLLDETQEELHCLIEQAKCKQEQAARLYTSLGALGGLAAALMMM